MITCLVCSRSSQVLNVSNSCNLCVDCMVRTLEYYFCDKTIDFVTRTLEIQKEQKRINYLSDVLDRDMKKYIESFTPEDVVENQG